MWSSPSLRHVLLTRAASQPGMARTVGAAVKERDCANRTPSDNFCPLQIWMYGHLYPHTDGVIPLTARERTSLLGAEAPLVSLFSSLFFDRPSRWPYRGLKHLLSYADPHLWGLPLPHLSFPPNGPIFLFGIFWTCLYISSRFFWLWRVALFFFMPL